MFVCFSLFPFSHVNTISLRPHALSQLHEARGFSSPPNRARRLGGGARERGRGGDGVRGAPRARAADGAAAEGRAGVRHRRERALRGAARPGVQRQVRERAALRPQRLRHAQLRPDRRALRRHRAGALPLVPRQGHPGRRPELRPHLLRRRRRLQAVLALALRNPAGLRRRPCRDGFVEGSIHHQCLSFSFLTVIW